jgi:hypothetical protein
MGYVPPTFDEWKNPGLMLKRMQRNIRRRFLILWATIVLLTFILLGVLVHYGSRSDGLPTAPSSSVVGSAALTRVGAPAAKRRFAPGLHGPARGRHVERD